MHSWLLEICCFADSMLVPVFLSPDCCSSSIISYEDQTIGIRSVRILDHDVILCPGHCLAVLSCLDVIELNLSWLHLSFHGHWPYLIICYNYGCPGLVLGQHQPISYAAEKLWKPFFAIFAYDNKASVSVLQNCSGSWPQDAYFHLTFSVKVTGIRKCDVS